MGTGTGDMIRRCSEAGLPEPEFGVRDGFVTTVRRKLIDTNVLRKKFGEKFGEIGSRNPWFDSQKPGNHHP
jgi:predicted HTH transcriptional regulator